jgi:hypothetical protein
MCCLLAMAGSTDASHTLTARDHGVLTFAIAPISISTIAPTSDSTFADPRQHDRTDSRQPRSHRPRQFAGFLPHAW